MFPIQACRRPYSLPFLFHHAQRTVCFQKDMGTRLIFWYHETVYVPNYVFFFFLVLPNCHWEVTVCWRDIGTLHPLQHLCAYSSKLKPSCEQKVGWHQVLSDIFSQQRRVGTSTGSNSGSIGQVTEGVQAYLKYNTPKG